ncbi:hypothetical protein FJT64_007172 [Amphibalanus amphitrite]|uniref:Uncharacterized protein n=1 Tax=Amphibalanus amphitrite TaxID=1232801 RepID=A0A6A4VNQ1_AMPAM|nr:hypothetical protein FJT64_007172 [Amphibalanus amphitrite]
MFVTSRHSEYFDCEGAKSVFKVCLLAAAAAVVTTTEAGLQRERRDLFSLFGLGSRRRGRNHAGGRGRSRGHGHGHEDIISPNEIQQQYSSPQPQQTYDAPQPQQQQQQQAGGQAYSAPRPQDVLSSGQAQQQYSAPQQQQQQQQQSYDAPSPQQQQSYDAPSPQQPQAAGPGGQTYSAPRPEDILSTSEVQQLGQQGSTHSPFVQAGSPQDFGSARGQSVSQVSLGGGQSQRGQSTGGSIVSEEEAAEGAPLSDQGSQAPTGEYGPPDGGSVVSEVTLQQGQDFVTSPASGGEQQLSFEGVFSGNQQSDAQPVSFEGTTESGGQSESLDFSSVFSQDEQPRPADGGFSEAAAQVNPNQVDLGSVFQPAQAQEEYSAPAQDQFSSSVQPSDEQGLVQAVDSPTQGYLAPESTGGSGQSGSPLPDIDIRANLQKVVTDQVDETVRNAFMTANPLVEEAPSLEETLLTRADPEEAVSSLLLEGFPDTAPAYFRGFELSTAAPVAPELTAPLGLPDTEVTDDDILRQMELQVQGMELQRLSGPATGPGSGSGEPSPLLQLLKGIEQSGKLRRGPDQWARIARSRSETSTLSAVRLVAELARSAAPDALPAATAAPTDTDDVRRVTPSSRGRRRRLGSRTSPVTAVTASTTPDPETEAIRAAMLELARL